MAEEFQRLNVQVDYLFSGRDKNNYFDMDVFGNAQYFHGLSFVTKNNKIDHLATVVQSHPLRFIKELRQVDILGYDLIISDFEPLTAWRSRFSNIPTLGLGHQYSFLSGAPWPKYDLLGRTILKHFAPTKQHLGMHWHHFGAKVLPPMIDVSLRRQSIEEKFVLVYLPFDESESAIQTLTQLPNTKFVFYSPQHQSTQHDKNVVAKPLSKANFKKDLQNCSWLVSSCGFGLVSEALHLGIPMLTIPIKGQGEQIANALALKQLGYTTRCRHLNAFDLKAFIEYNPVQAVKSQMNYPNVAAQVAQYCVNGSFEQPESLVKRLWNDCSPASNTTI